MGWSNPFPITQQTFWEQPTWQCNSALKRVGVEFRGSGGWAPHLFLIPPIFSSNSHLFTTDTCSMATLRPLANAQVTLKGLSLWPRSMGASPVKAHDLSWGHRPMEKKTYLKFLWWYATPPNSTISRFILIPSDRFCWGRFNVVGVARNGSHVTWRKTFPRPFPFLTFLIIFHHVKFSRETFRKWRFNKVHKIEMSVNILTLMFSTWTVRRRGVENHDAGWSCWPWIVKALRNFFLLKIGFGDFKNH